MTGLFGGAFDPPHNGHVALVAEAIQRFGLERVVAVPTGVAPHKPIETPGDVRYRLAEAAFGGIPSVEVSRWELDRGTPSYSVETTRWARSRFGEVMFLVGADQFAAFESWHEPEAVLALARLGVATRPGYSPERLQAVLERIPHRDRVEIFEIPAVAVSSSQVRERVARGEPIDDLVPGPVARLIDELRLYRAT